jgi:hypothetical protein
MGEVRREVIPWRMEYYSVQRGKQAASQLKTL